MHDITDQGHWHEPKAGENAGFGKFARKPMPYDSFMEAEGVPVYRGIGVRRVQIYRCNRGSGLGPAAATFSFMAPKAYGALTWSRCRAPAR